MNTRTPAVALAAPSTMPAAVATAATGGNMADRRSCRNHRLFLSPCPRSRRRLSRLRLGLGLIHQPNRSSMQISKLRLSRFILGEFDQIAPLQKLTETLLLLHRQQGGCLQVMQELLCRPFWRAEIKSFFKVVPDRV